MAKQTSRSIKRAVGALGITMITMCFYIPGAMALTLNDGQVHTISNWVGDISVYNNINPPHNRTTLILNGSSFGSVAVYQDSLFELDGYFAGPIATSDRSIAVLNGATDIMDGGGDHSIWIVHGFPDGLHMDGHATLIFEDSFTNIIELAGHSTATILGLSGVNTFFAGDDADVVMHGEFAGESLRVKGNVDVVTYGSFFEGDVSVGESADVVIHGRGFNVPLGTYTASSNLTHLEGTNIYIGGVIISDAGRITLVPEPSTMLLLGSGLLGLWGFRKKFKK